MMTARCKFILLLLVLTSLNAHAVRRNLTRDDVESKAEVECELVLATEGNNEAIAEAILFLSYDHPLVHHVVKRAKSAYDIELFLNILWGLQYPLYVAPGAKIADNSDEYLTRAKNGDFVFPLLMIKKDFNEDGYEEDDFRHDIRRIFTTRTDNYLVASSWKKWKVLSYERREEIANLLLNNIYNVLKMMDSNKKKHSELDPRTNEQHVTYQLGGALYYSDRRISAGPDLLLPEGYDLLLPAEFAKFLNIFGRVYIHKSLNKPLVAYLAEHLPLLIERRIEALNLIPKRIAEYQSKTLVGQSRIGKLGMRLLHPFSKSKPSSAKTSEPADDRSYLASHYTVDELKLAITESTGPAKFRILQDVTRLRTTEDALPQPDEMKLDAPTETPFNYDLKQFTAGLQIPTELPAGKIKQNIISIPDPTPENFTTPGQVRSYGAEVFFYLNLLTQNLSALRAGGYENLAQTLTSFIVDLEQLGAKMDTKKFHELRLHLSALETSENAIHLQTEQIEAEITAFIAKVDKHLTALNTFSESIQENDELKLAAISKIEELQTVFILCKAQMQPALKLRKENQNLLYKSLKQLQIQLATLTTKAVLDAYTTEDMISLSESLIQLRDALQLKANHP